MVLKIRLKFPPESQLTGEMGQTIAILGGVFFGVIIDCQWFGGLAQPGWRITNHRVLLLLRF
jgi:hypothetical protein